MDYEQIMLDYPVLTYDETVDLYRKFENDKDALREKMVLHNIGLAVTAANKFAKPHTPEWDDMLSEGIIALHKAIDGYNPDLGFRFSTYAYRVMQSHFSDYFARMKKEPPMVHLDAPVGNEEDSATVEQLIYNRISPDAILVEPTADRLIRRSKREFAKAAVKEMLDLPKSKAEQKRLEMTIEYLSGDHRNGSGDTLEAIGKRMGKTRERVRQIVLKEAHHIRHYLSRKWSDGSGEDARERNSLVKEIVQT